MNSHRRKLKTVCTMMKGKCVKNAKKDFLDPTLISVKKIKNLIIVRFMKKFRPNRNAKNAPRNIFTVELSVKRE